MLQGVLKRAGDCLPTSKVQISENPLVWNMGLNDNADLKTSMKDIMIGLYEGKYATGEEFAAAMDALY